MYWLMCRSHSLAGSLVVVVAFVLALAVLVLVVLVGAGGGDGIRAGARSFF